MIIWRKLVSFAAFGAVLTLGVGCVAGANSSPAPGVGPSEGPLPSGGSAGGPGIPIEAGVDPALLPTFGTTVSAKAPPPPISGGTLITLTDGQTAVAADPDRDAVYVVDIPSRVVKHSIALQPGDEPGRLVEDGAGRVHVALRSGGSLVTIDPVQGSILTRRSVCPAPRGVTWDASTDLVWVACATGELVSLPAAGGAATANVVVERDLRDILIDNGSLSVTSFRSAEVLRLDSTMAVLRRDEMPSVPIAQPQVLWRAVAGPSHSIVAVHQEHSTAPIQTDAGASYGSGGPESSAVTGECTVMGSDGTVSTTISVEAVLPVDVAVSPDGSFAAVVGAGDSLASGLQSMVVVPLQASPAAVAKASAAGGCAQGSPCSQGSGCGTATPVGGCGMSCACDPTGHLQCTDLCSVDGDASAVIPAPPSGGPFSSPTVRQGVRLPLGAQAIAVAFDSNSHVLIQTREPANLWVIPTPAAANVNDEWPTPTNPVVLSSVSRDDTGHDIFHASAGALIACASCHPEGGEDSHVWLLDGMSKRTPSLRGTVAGTAPYHWLGDQPDFPTLTNNVYTRRMSGQSLDDGQIGALKSWVEAIPAPPSPSWLDGAGVARGLAVFQRPDTACASCHSGPKFTNNATMDVGTGAAFQVPPLVGVGWRTPLLHSGCAATIADRFGNCASPGHGDLSALTQQDITDLATYLESL
jgi:hypothetical protein